VKRAVLLLLALGESACHDGRVDLERMIDQKRCDPYEASTLFDDGMAMRSPPPGTVPRSAGATREVPTNTGPEVSALTAVPLPLTRELLGRGQNRFNVYCATCHGELGDGRSKVAENMLLRPPPSLHDARIRSLPAGRLYAIVRDGYGLMPGYAAALSTEDRWAVVAYVGVLQLSQNAELTRLPARIQEEARPWLN